MISKSTSRNSITYVVMLFFFASCVIAQPDVPIPISPQCESVFVVPATSTYMTIFKWTAALRAHMYRLQVSVTPDFTSILLDVKTLNTFSGPFSFTWAIVGSTYYWRVNASDTVGTSPWSEICYFRVLHGDLPTTIQTVLRTDKTSYVQGEIVNLTLSVSNTGMDTVFLNFYSSQQYDFTATTSGSLVWRWSQGRVFLPVILPVRLSPGQTITYREIWNQKSNSGSQVPPGSYVMQGILTNTPSPSVPSASTTITISPPTDVHDDEPVPQYTLSQNYPNPFNPSTKIKFALPESEVATATFGRAKVNLSIYNLLGEKVAELVSGEMDAGYHEKQWNASGLVSGIYFYRLQAGKFIETKKLILMK